MNKEQQNVVIRFMQITTLK